MSDASALLVRYLRQRRELGETELVFAGHPLRLKASPAASPPDRLASESRTITPPAAAPPPRSGVSVEGSPELPEGQLSVGSGNDPGRAASLSSFAPTAGPATRLVIVAEEPEEAPGDPSHAIPDRSLRLLHTLLTAIGLSITEVYVHPLSWCYLPARGNGRPEEVEEWEAGLRQQLTGIAPGAILSFGVAPTQILLKTSGAIGTLRGGTHAWGDVPLVPTYALAMIRQNPAYIRPVWEDLQRVRAILDR